MLVNRSLEDGSWNEVVVSSETYWYSQYTECN